jgi:hypothetical protein
MSAGGPCVYFPMRHGSDRTFLGHQALTDTEVAEMRHESGGATSLAGQDPTARSSTVSVSPPRDDAQQAVATPKAIADK